MLPPTVPLARTWTEPKRRISSPRSGWIAPTSGVGRGERHAGADRQCAVGGLRDHVEAIHPPEPDDPLQIAQELGDPEPDIGGAGDQRRVGIALVEGSERVEAGRRGEEAALVADEEVRVVGERGKRTARCSAVAAKRSFGAPSQVASPPSGSGDSRCSGKDCRRAGRRGSQRSRARRNGRRRTGSSRCQACRSRIASRAGRPSPAAPDAGHRRRRGPRP